MARRRTRKQGDDLAPHGPVQRAVSEEELAAQRSDSPEAGVARLAQAAGNDAVAAMLQRFQAGEDEEIEQQSQGGSFEEPIEQQAQEPPAPQQAEQSGGGDQFAIGDNIDGGGIEGGEQQSAEGSQETEFQGREERVAGGQGGTAAPNVGPVVGITAGELKSMVAQKLGKANGQTRDLADGLCDAVAAAWSTWQSTATIVGVSVNAVTATGGQLVGPPLGPLVSANGAGVDKAAAAALGAALGSAHARFVAGFSLPGLPLFPSFAAIPSPVAPPTPSIPMPMLAAAPNSGAFDGASAGIKLKDAQKQQAAAAVADAVASIFPLWLARALFFLLGTGPVPTFAPPYVPVGPVVGGDAFSVPGGISG